MYGHDICYKIDNKQSFKPIPKAVKVMQTMLCNPDTYIVEKLQRLLKNNKAEFLRVLFMYNEVSDSLYNNPENKHVFLANKGTN
jgi:hypothetical protein